MTGDADHTLTSTLHLPLYWIFEHLLSVVCYPASPFSQSPHCQACLTCRHPLLLILPLPVVYLYSLSQRLLISLLSSPLLSLYMYMYIFNCHSNYTFLLT